MSKIVCLLDNGHGFDTKGKRSPDERLLEYAWARIVARKLKEVLEKAGHTVILVTPEDNDISLSERTRRVNSYCTKYGTANCVVVSIHINAQGNGTSWGTASGWTAWVAPNASTKSKELAKILHAEAVAHGLKGNRWIPTEGYWVGNYAIVRDTKCPAVLTENLFMDNKTEVEYLLSEEGINTIVQLHKDGLEKYMKKYGN